MATVISTDSKPRRRRKRGSDRWLSEVKGIVALLAAGFGLIALATFDPALTPAEQQGLTGPVGVWLGWATFQSFGYAGFLLPLLLGAWGASAFLRPIVVRGWVPLAGLAVLLVSAAGLLTQATRVRSGAIGGGLIGYAATGMLRASFGDVGAWLMLIAAVPIGVLCVTRVSYAAVVRVTTSRLTRLRRRRAQSAPAARVAVEPMSVAEPVVPPATELKRTREELQENAETIRRKLLDFEVEGRIVQVSPGPIITSYEFEPAAGVKISQVVNLGDDLALALKSASVRIVGPIPGRGTVAIEVPNAEAATVHLREIFVSAEFAESKGRLPLALGKDVTGTPVVSDLTAMPHLLVAGATGSGKSVGLNSMICSILYKATPADVRFLLIDPKRLELSVYEGIPHLLAPVVTDAKEAAARLRWIVGKMDERYKTLQVKQVRSIEGYNKAVGSEERLPYWVVVVDELADLMMVSAGEVQTSLVRLAQIARAVGIHLIIATQRPSVDVVTGLIKANFPTRIAFQVASKVDSRTVLDGNGAEQLLGRGDMIFVPPGANKQTRVHGAWVGDDEVRAVCDFLRRQGTAVYEEVVLATEEEVAAGAGAERDDLYWDAVHLVIGQHQASISFLQRRMRLGYPKAARFIDMMEQDRVIGPGDGAKPREVLVGPEYLAKRGR